jgi:hypothetical protein
VRGRAIFRRWSPDGLLLAVMEWDGSRSVRLVDVDGRDQGQLPSAWGDAWQAIP